MSSIIQVAIIENEELIRDALIALFKLIEGFKVLISTTGLQDFADECINCNTLPDICIIDVQTFRNLGFDAISKINVKYPQIRCVVLAHEFNEQVALNLFRAGIKGYILKSSPSPLFIKNLQEVYKTGSCVPEELKKVIPRFRLDDINAYTKYKLSPEQTEFLKLCSCDLTYDEIGKRMNKSKRTVERYATTLYQKLNIKTRAGLAEYSIKMGYGRVDNM